MTFVSAPLPARDSTREDSDMAEGEEADTDRADDAEGAAAVDAGRARRRNIGGTDATLGVTRSARCTRADAISKSKGPCTGMVV
jgi:hypothetical protein